jgi:hypothetical protein
MIDGKDEVERYAQKIIEQLKQVLKQIPADEVVFTSVQHEIGLTAAELIREIEGRTSIGVAILEHYAIHTFFTKNWFFPLG